MQPLYYKTTNQEELLALIQEYGEIIKKSQLKKSTWLN
jgi:hypothetical protein